MKTVCLNQAIISYVEFMRKVIDMKENPGDEITNERYHDFINLYRKMKCDKEIMDSVSLVRSSSSINPDLFKIYYVSMPQLWAFIHLVLEAKMDKTLSLSFNQYKPEDFMEIKSELKKLWFTNQNQHGLNFIYLEDEENKVDLEVKLCHAKSGFAQCKENLGKFGLLGKALKFNMDVMRKIRV